MMRSQGRFRPAFSLWAWLALSPFLVIALGGLDTASTEQEWALGFAASVIVDAVLAAVFVALGLLERMMAPVPWLRWAFVAAAIVGVAAARPLAATEAQRLLGIDLIQTGYPARFLLNLVLFTTGVCLIYLVRHAIDQMVDAKHRLLRVLAQLQAQAAAIETKRDQVALDFRRDVSAPVLDAIGSLVATELPTDELADELRRVSKTIVRQASQRIRGADLQHAIEELHVDPSRDAAPPTSGTSPALPPMRVTPGAPWIVSLCSLIIFIPAEFNAQGVLLGALLLLGGTVVSFVGAWLLTKTPLPQHPVAATLVIAVCSAAIGLLMCFVMVGDLATHPLVGFYAAYCTIGYVVLSVGIAFVTSALRTVSEHQHRIALALGESKQRVLRARQSLEAIAHRTDCLLHTGIQGDIIATSLHLKLGTADSGAVTALLERVESALEDPFGEVSSTETLKQVISTALDAWSLSLDIEIDVDDGALQWIADHAGAAEVAFEAFSEGLTNAIRHGRTERARVAIRKDHDGVEIVVTNPGRLPSRVVGGMGLHELDLHARAVTLVQAGHDVELRVSL